jgi:hypothetical protein
MAVINKTGITNGGTIQAEHITRAIDALSGISTDTIIATGSFSGSLTGLATSASFAVSASRSVSSSFSTTASFAANASSFPFTGSARITGSLSVTGSTSLNGALSGSITGSSTLILNLSTLGSSGNFILPTTAPSTPTRGSVYWDFGTATLYIFDGSVWQTQLFTPAG